MIPIKWRGRTYVGGWVELIMFLVGRTVYKPNIDDGGVDVSDDDDEMMTVVMSLFGEYVIQQ